MGQNKFNISFLILMIYITLLAAIAGIVVNNFLLINVKIETPGDYLEELVTLDLKKTKFILREGLPLLKGKREIKTNKEAISALDKGLRIIPYSIVIKKEEFETKTEIKNLANKEEKLEAEGTHEGEEGKSINLWQTAPPEPYDLSDTFEDEIREEEKVEQDENRFFADDVLVGIYHAHTAEGYSNGDSDYRAAIGEKGDVVAVGEHLAETLKSKHNIVTTHSKKIHDEIHSRSYIKALPTAKEIVEENQNLKMLFDIHRDAVPGASKDFTTTKIEGEEVANIMIVVTNDQYNLPHPNWKQNLQFARQLGNKMEQMYPGLLREVKLIENRRYNQHLHPGTVLLEVGSTKNDLSEAKRAMELFADVIAESLRQKSYSNFDYLD